MSGLLFLALFFTSPLVFVRFDDPLETQRLSQVLDAINRKHERSVQIASLLEPIPIVPTRIPFGTPDQDSSQNLL